MQAERIVGQLGGETMKFIVVMVQIWTIITKFPVAAILHIMSYKHMNGKPDLHMVTYTEHLYAQPLLVVGGEVLAIRQ